LVSCRKRTFDAIAHRTATRRTSGTLATQHARQAENHISQPVGITLLERIVIMHPIASTCSFWVFVWVFVYKPNTQTNMLLPARC
jgi:hypothetical protein